MVLRKRRRRRELSMEVHPRMVARLAWWISSEARPGREAFYGYDQEHSILVRSRRTLPIVLRCRTLGENSSTNLQSLLLGQHLENLAALHAPKAVNHGAFHRTARLWVSDHGVDTWPHFLLDFLNLSLLTISQCQPCEVVLGPICSSWSSQRSRLMWNRHGPGLWRTALRER